MDDGEKDFRLKKPFNLFKWKKFYKLVILL